jgi:hypothetical protein
MAPERREMETETRQPQPYRNPLAEPNWSGAEKEIARKVFQSALEKELQDTVNAARQKMAKITRASELWDLEDWLGRQRRQIDEKYDYRYSVLLMLFVRLIAEGRLSESDLDGLHSDKIDYIRRILSFAKR